MFLNSTASIPYILLCLLFAAAFSTWMYRKQSASFVSILAFRLAWAMRFIALSIVFVLLLGWMLLLVHHRTEKPILFIALDQSASIKANADSLYYKQQFPTQWNEWANAMSDEFQVIVRGFDDAVHTTFNPTYPGSHTNIAQMLDEVQGQYYHQNLAAIVLASDGIVNAGENPLLASGASGVPIYTVTLGDSIPHCDARISDCRYNAFVYQGNPFEIQADIHAQACAGKQLQVQVMCDGKSIYAQTIPVTKPQFTQTIRCILPAQTEGAHSYVMQISPLKEEKNTSNNVWDFVVDVLRTKQKIGIYMYAPHPDISAIKQLLESMQQAEVSVHTIQDIHTIPWKQSDIILLHQLPGPNGEGVSFIREIQKQKIPTFSILGSQTGFSHLSLVDAPVEITGNRGQSNRAEAFVNETFSLFQSEKEWNQAIQSWPPLTTPYGRYRLENGSEIYCYQKINGIQTDVPLLVFSRNPNNSVMQGYMLGEGIWKWYLQEYSRNGNHLVLEQLFARWMQVVSKKEDKSTFRIKPLQRIFYENDPVIIDAEVYNQNLEQVRSADIDFILKNSAGKIYTYRFSPYQQAYRLDIGTLPAGRYAYEARVKIGNQIELKKGWIVVSAMQVELMQTRSNPVLLRQLASQTGAISVGLNQLDEIKNHLQKQKQVKPVIYTEEETRDLASWWPVLLALITAFSIEWFIRKWSGLI